MGRFAFVAVATTLITSAAALAVRNSTEPCAQIAAESKAGSHQFNADIALACLKSVPLQKGDNLMIEGVKSMVAFHSDLAYLKNPPPGFLYPGVDVLGSLDQILSALKSGAYSNEYDLQMDLANVITSCYDFHFYMSPDILKIIYWERAEALISVATDPTSLPDVYVEGDKFVLAGQSSGYKPSPVVKINGIDVEQFLNSAAAFSPWSQDVDANYNAMFPNPALKGLNIRGGNTFKTGGQAHQFLGSETTLTFANGTRRNVDTYAVSYQDWSGVTDGKTFAEAFLHPPPAPSASASAAASAGVSASLFASASASGSVLPSSSAPASSGVAKRWVTTQNAYTPVPTTSKIAAPTGYPEPFIISPGKFISGYFPEQQNDLVVISVPTFGPANNAEFEDVFRSILATAKKAGKSKCIIDIRGNGGGHVANGYDLFKQLFPSKVPYGGTNIAAFPLIDAIGQVGSSSDGKLDESGNFVPTFDYRLSLDESLTRYSSWEDFYGPVKNYGGEFTHIHRYNLSNVDSLGAPIYGYINDTRSQPQTFDPNNIVLLSDSFCGSTCAVFAELMKTAGVQAIAVGGRKQEGPMQWVGGSKGANDQYWLTLAGLASDALSLANSKEKALFEPYLKAGLIDQLNQLFFRLGGITEAGGNAHLNWLNNLRKGDGTNTPLQFVYEAANCRFFYTAEMLFDQSLVWNQAYRLRWGDGTCVKGSDGELSAVTGFHTGYIDSKPPESATNFFGADITWSYPGAYKLDSHPPKPLTTPSASSSGKGATATGKKSSGAAGTRSMMLLAENGPGGLFTLLLSPLLAVAALLFVL